MNAQQLQLFLDDLERREINDTFKRENRHKGIRGSYKAVDTGWTKRKGNWATIVNGVVEYI